MGGVIALVYLGFVVYLFSTGQKLLGLGALFGLAFGVLIERGQICFTSAFRDLFLVGRSLMTKAIIIGMAASSVITFVVISVYDMTPITQIAALSTLVGGVLFGLGIVMASGCETGMMYRLMEGQVLFLPVFAGNVIGATVLAYGWDNLGIYDVLVQGGDKVNLIATLGPAGAILSTLEALEGMNKGELLQVITDCPGSFRNVPEEAVAHGYTFAQDPVKNGQEYFFIFMPSESGGYCRHQTVTGTTHTGFPQD